MHAICRLTARLHMLAVSVCIRGLDLMASMRCLNKVSLPGELLAGLDLVTRLSWRGCHSWE
jgi:hypothetical protein